MESHIPPTTQDALAALERRVEVLEKALEKTRAHSEMQAQARSVLRDPRHSAEGHEFARATLPAADYELMRLLADVQFSATKAHHDFFRRKIEEYPPFARDLADAIKSAKDGEAAAAGLCARFHKEMHPTPEETPNSMVPLLSTGGNGKPGQTGPGGPGGPIDIVGPSDST